MRVDIAEKFFKVMGSKVKATETFAGGGMTINGSPLKSILFPEMVASHSMDPLQFSFQRASNYVRGGLLLWPFCLYVCLSVCLSNTWIVTKRNNRL